MLSKQTLEICMELLGGIKMSPMQPDADTTWKKVIQAREELTKALEDIKD